MSGIIQFTFVLSILSCHYFKIATDTVGLKVAERHAQILIYDVSDTYHVIYQTFAIECLSGVELQLATLA